MAVQTKWYALTAAHRKEFESYVRFWQERLGLRAWRIKLHTNLFPARGTMAEVKTDLEQRSAGIRLAKEFKNTPPTPLELDKLAFHELMHILNHEIKVWAAEHGEADHSDVISAEHIQINVIEALVFGSRKR